MKVSHSKRIACAAASVLFLFGGCVRGGKENGQTTEPEITAPPSGNLYTESPGAVKKTETVYVTLDTSGAVLKTIVTDWLHTDRAGVRVEDASDLGNISTVKGSAVSVREGDNIVWHMDGTDLYYTGQSDKPLPIGFEFEFFINNKEYSAKEIKGKSGNVIINIRAVNGDARDVYVDGKRVTMYNPFIVIGGTIIPQENFSDVTVQHGRSFGDGSKEIVFSVMTPGLAESLGDTGTVSGYLGGLEFTDGFTISAKTSNFQLGSMYFAVIPVASLDLGTALPETMGDIKEMLSGISGFRKTIESAGADRLIQTLLKDPARLEKLAGAVGDTIGLYNSNRKLLNVMSEYLTPENLAMLMAAAESIKNIEIEEYIDLLLDERFQSLISELGAAAENMQELIPVLEAMSKDMSDPEVQAAIRNLPQTLNKLSEIRVLLDENSDFLTALSKLLNSGSIDRLSELFEALNGIIDSNDLEKYSALTKNASELIARAGEWLKLGSGYKIFTASKENMLTSLVFIYEAGF